MKKLMLMGAVVFALLSFNTQAADFSREEIEKIIHDYIASNGGVIADSVDKYLADERRAAAAHLISKHTPVTGNVEAEVAFVEFSDFRCGYCKRVQATVTKLREKYGDRVKFAFKNMPILSEESRQAALAASAAHKQGKFWEYSKGLWENQSRLGEDLFVELATKNGLKVADFNKDRVSKEIADQNKIDIADGQSAGVQGTPFFVIDGTPLSGAQPISEFERVIEAALSARNVQ